MHFSHLPDSDNIGSKLLAEMMVGACVSEHRGERDLGLFSSVEWGCNTECNQFEWRKGMEVANMMVRRCIDVLCLQET